LDTFGGLRNKSPTVFVKKALPRSAQAPFIVLWTMGIYRTLCDIICG